MLPPQPPGQTPPPQPPKRRLDEATLRRFVFQTFGRARRTQDSPIMPDVWLRYIRVAEDAARRRATAGSGVDTKIPSDDGVDLLLTPLTGTTPGYIAERLRGLLKKDDRHTAARIAMSTSRVVAKVSFLTLIRDIVPLTGWWQQYFDGFRTFQWLFRSSYEDENITLKDAMSSAGLDIEFFRYAALVGFIDRLMNVNSWYEIENLENLARQLGPPTSDEAGEQDETEQTESERRARMEVSEPKVKDFEVLIRGFESATGQRVIDMMPPPSAERGLAGAVEPKGIFLINLNRPAAQSLFDSRLTVKADAAHRVFDINTEGIAFAVIDGGIDATHVAFLRRSLLNRSDLKEPDKALAKKYEEEREKIVEADLERWSRVVQTYDFTILRDIVASSGDPQAASPVNRDAIQRIAQSNATAFEHLTTRNDSARDLDWEIVRPLIRIPHTKDYRWPGSDHGTHVAGILAADLPNPVDSRHALIGMCPSLSLFDLRVFDAEGRGDEFAILCAIEFVGWLNRDRTMPVVHGVNLSLALAHDVDSFACGQTPICEACDHLVGAGTVVVASAGNTGFEGAAKQSLGTGYRAISITDPGNADGVITVGSTHRRDPHLYGVSFFSARGPTGDGRRKPDLLAPGEKITSTIRGGRSQRMDGTSMAAPHVSGAAALLMARYPELIGRPFRIKEILMASATDLKREPSFQGAGLLDVLRALQSV
jgi:serine protease AprX